MNIDHVTKANRYFHTGLQLQALCYNIIYKLDLLMKSFMI